MEYRMASWLFQGNPDLFDIDRYFEGRREVLWTVRQPHLAPHMHPGDPVFFWRAAGDEKGDRGVIAAGALLEVPRDQDDDPEAVPFWKGKTQNGSALRVRIELSRVCNRKKGMVRIEWLKDDPVLSDLPPVR